MFMLIPKISDHFTISALKPCVSNEDSVGVPRDPNVQIGVITLAAKPDETGKRLAQTRSNPGKNASGGRQCGDDTVYLGLWDRRFRAGSSPRETRQHPAQRAE
jgi:hypothetical protein